MPQIRIKDSAGREMGLIDDEREVTHISEDWKAKSSQSLEVKEAEKALEDKNES